MDEQSRSDAATPAAPPPAAPLAPAMPRPTAPSPFAPPQPAAASRRVSNRLLPVELATYAVVVATAIALVLYFALRD